MKKKKVVARDISYDKLEAGQEIKGSLESQDKEDKLMKTVLQSDKAKIEEGKIIAEAVNQGIMGFNPDMMFSNIVKNFQVSQDLYGEKLMRLITGYSSDYIKRNLGIPEFQKEMRGRIERRIGQMETLEKGTITDEGLYLAALVMYSEELDNIEPRGQVGEYVHKKISHYGDKEECRGFKKGDRYKDIGIRKSIRKAIRRGHGKVERGDLITYERGSRGKINVIYGLDASGSMKGRKIEVAKKAGIALAYKAINKKDKVGLVVFGSVRKDVEPTDDFIKIIKTLASIRASKETDMTEAIKKASEMFNEEGTKHLVLLTDALPTVGDRPEEETLKAVSIARSNDVTVSLIGINLDKKGKELAEKITTIGVGRLYAVKDLKKIDKIILEDYYQLL